LVEAKTDALTLLERLPPKIHQIQEELPAWMQKSGNRDKAAEATALMQKMQEQLKARDFEEAEKTADSILKMMDPSRRG
jgi:prophage DNA circulation protein